MSELKPCPFCGEQAMVDKDFCGCSNGDCFNVGYMYLTSEWNTRPIEDALRTENEALNKKVAEMEDSLTTAYLYAKAECKDDIDAYVTEITAGRLKIERLEAENQRMREALRILKLTFETYVSIHKLKPKSAENDIKIERNQEMVETCENALKGGE